MSKSHFLVKLRKFESAPTVMYCILSSFIQENTQAFNYNLQPLLVGYLVAVIYKVGTVKIKRRKPSKQKSSMHEIKMKFFKC